MRNLKVVQIATSVGDKCVLFALREDGKIFVRDMLDSEYPWFEVMDVPDGPPKIEVELEYFPK